MTQPADQGLSVGIVRCAECRREPQRRRCLRRDGVGIDVQGGDVLAWLSRADTVVMGTPAISIVVAMKLRRS